jgi:predicted DNA-binding transcriptional regulator AlpA
VSSYAGHADRIPISTETIRELGPTTDVPTAGALFGLSRTQSYVAIQRGQFPVSVIRIGRRVVVPVAPILELLGLAEPREAPDREKLAAVTA